MIALRKLLALLLAVLLLSGCAAVPVETEPPETTEAPTVAPETEPKSTRKIVGYTPDDEPIYEDQIVIPVPFY